MGTKQTAEEKKNSWTEIVAYQKMLKLNTIRCGSFCSVHNGTSHHFIVFCFFFLFVCLFS